MTPAVVYLIAAGRGLDVNQIVASDRHVPCLTVDLGPISVQELSKS